MYWLAHKTIEQHDGEEQDSEVPHVLRPSISECHYLKYKKVTSNNECVNGVTRLTLYEFGLEVPTSLSRCEPI